MSDRLVVRWPLVPQLTGVASVPGTSGIMGVIVTVTSDDLGLRLGIGVAATALLGTALWMIVRPRFVFDPAAIRLVSMFRSRRVPWDRVVACQWQRLRPQWEAGPGWHPKVTGSDDRPLLPLTGQVPNRRLDDVNDWLRVHQPEIRIDPVAPWRDRFGVWHVAEPGYDPVETMMSVRRSLVGPWEIVAMSCDGGFRAEQRVVRSGEVVACEPVRETLAEAKADGVRLVCEAVEAAASAHE